MRPNVLWIRVDLFGEDRRAQEERSMLRKLGVAEMRQQALEVALAAGESTSEKLDAARDEVLDLQARLPRGDVPYLLLLLRMVSGEHLGVRDRLFPHEFDFARAVGIGGQLVLAALPATYRQHLANRSVRHIILLERSDLCPSAWPVMGRAAQTPATSRAHCNKTVPDRRDTHHTGNAAGSDSIDGVAAVTGRGV